METDEKPRYDWSKNPKFRNIERNLSLNYEERFIIVNALGLLEDACQIIGQWERSGDVRRLARRFASERWERYHVDNSND